uniref:NAD-dependent epimerase/dehydratase domain-containing protein n=2 Tax=Aegilops tauschii subsp. strangulata TaxID=200361 RepID=A0A453HQD7_AEGTS
PEPIYKAMASTYHYRLPYPLPLTAAPPASASRCRFPMASTAPLGVTVSTSESVGQNDLLIVGPGVLGRIVAEKWRQEHPDCKIYGQTATTDHHSELTKIGIIPSLKGPRVDQKVPYVIFCAPPYRTDDYPGDLRVAASNWSGEGSFLFTSSTAVYDCNDNGFCGEDSPCVPIGMSPRTDVLLKAENVVLEAGGCALRLAGLYKKDQGPHVFWLSKGTVDARPDLIISMIHYEDAASLGIAIMKRRLRGRVFVGCDNQPLSRQEIMDRVNRSGKFDGKFEGFTGTDGPLGKRMDNSKTRAEIGWEPKYPSFTEFLGLSN